MHKTIKPPAAATAEGISLTNESSQKENTFSVNFNSLAPNTPVTVDRSALVNVAKLYVNRNLSVIPVRPDGTKSPAVTSWKPYQERRPTSQELDEWFNGRNGIGIIAGKISDNLEIIDFDAPELFEPWKQLVCDIAPRLFDKLAVTLTPSGGYHVYYRCDAIEGNQKLAQQVNTQTGRPKTLIETRGEGGYVVAPPSPPECHRENKPYQIYSGDLGDITTISSEERSVLLDSARSFDESADESIEPTGHKTRADGNRAGDCYSREFDSKKWGELLTKHGWVQVAVRRECEYWRRPGKAVGVSATLNYRGNNVLRVFSSNAFPFEGGHNYNPFAAYTYLEHNKDFKAAAKTLGSLGYGGPSPAKSGVSSSATEAVEDEASHVDTVGSFLITAALSDYGNAECMAFLYKDKLRYDHALANWRFWDGVRWREDNSGEATRLAIETLRKRQRAAVEIENLEARTKLMKFGLACERGSSVKSMLDFAEKLPPFSSTIEEYDVDTFLVTDRRGTLNLKTQEWYASRRDDKLTRQLGTQFIEHAAAPRWTQFLREVFAGDEELINFVKRAVGYSLTGETTEQVLFLCYGYGSNGKSKFLEVLSKLLGDYAGTASFEAFEAKNRSGVNNDLAALKGKRLVTVIESEQDRRLAEAKVKAVTGQDMISCRFLYGEFFEYRPQFKIWMAMNHKPVIRGTDNGIWRRIRLIPFTETFEGREDKNLSQKLETELPGILNWALEGLAEWQDSGLQIPKAVKEATEEYRRESDSIGQWLDECTISCALKMMRLTEAYRNYCSWAADRGEHPYGQRAWSQALVEKGFKKDRDASGYRFWGAELLA